MAVTCMARIAQLPADVVHILLAHLGAGDLPAVALVCHLFCAVATPRIYSHVRYTPHLAKQHGTIISPFDLLVARAELLAHLRSLDIRAVPLHRDRPSPPFTRACLHVVSRAPYLTSFAWASPGRGSALLPAVLRLLAASTPDPVSPTAAGIVARSPLTRLSITDDCLSPSDAQYIHSLGPVHHITLHKPSIGAIRALAEWIAPSDSDLSNSRVLTLGLSHAHVLEPDLLGRILRHTPDLRSLSVTDCVQISHLALFSILFETQLALESLSFTLSAGWSGAAFPLIPTLRHISISIIPPEEPLPDRWTDAPADPLAQRLLRNLFDALPRHTLHSITIKLSSPRSLTDKVAKLLITQHGPTLRRLNLFRLGLSAVAIGAMLRRLPHLEQLSVGLPLDQFDTLINSLSTATHLHTLVDTSPCPTVSSTARAQPRPGKANAPNRSLTRAQAGQLLLAGPALANVISQGRNWMKEHQWNAGRYETVVSMRRMRGH